MSQYVVKTRQLNSCSNSSQKLLIFSFHCLYKELINLVFYCLTFIIDSTHLNTLRCYLSLIGKIDIDFRDDVNINNEGKEIKYKIY